MNTLRAFILLISIILWADLSSPAQSTLGESSNLYARALGACVSAEQKEYARFFKDGADRYKNRVVEWDLFLTEREGLPTHFGDITIEYLRSDDLEMRFKKTKKAIPILSLRPITNEGPIIKVSILNYWYSKSKKSHDYGLEGGCTVSFKFDPAINNFAILDVKLSGV